MQVQGLVTVLVAWIGDALGLISGSLVVFGNHLVEGAKDTTYMGLLTNGIFGTKDGLLYWMKNDVFYILKAFNELPIADGLTALLKAIIVGLGIGA